MSDRHVFLHSRASGRKSISAGVGVAVTVAAEALILQGLNRRAYAAGDETIKVALVGCGSRGSGAAAQALQTKGPIKLWAMADLFSDRLEASLASLSNSSPAVYDREAHQGLAHRIDVPPQRRFVGFDAYRQAIDSGVDLVILASPPHFRPAHFAYAVQQGKHLFAEKPLAVDSPGIRQILAANEEAKRKNLKMGRCDPVDGAAGAGKVCNGCRAAGGCRPGRALPGGNARHDEGALTLTSRRPAKGP